MRTETITRHLYRFEELDDGAKERAREWWRKTLYLEQFTWHGEWDDSLRAFCRIAPIDVTEYQYGWGADMRVTWTGDDDIAELSGLRAWRWLNNNGPSGPVRDHRGRSNGGASWLDVAKDEATGNCDLTGFCGDAPLFDPIAEIQNPNSVPELRDLFEACAWRWLRALEQDYEAQFDDDAVDDMLTANEYEFDAEGRPA